MAVAEKSRITSGVGRGITLRCPSCGEGKLFDRFLKVSTSCSACGTDNSVYPSDDAPPYLTILLVGHLVLPFVFWFDRMWEPELWLQMLIWLPLLAGLTIGLLPFIKGAVVGFAWATGVTRGDTA